MKRLFRFGFFCLLIEANSLSAQTTDLPYSTLSLQNLSEFKAPGSGWKVVNDVQFDFRKTGNASTKAGSGVLINDLSGKGKDNLSTSIEHGDLDLDLEFMLDKGSQGGILLQGRYEIQLADSWGVQVPTSADCGAIAPRQSASGTASRQTFEGHAPAQNLSKAPGLWQRLQIRFRAPRFNKKGEKIENAQFVKVVQNGVIIHERTEVTGPTQGAPLTDEKPVGPLVIQGDGGPLAIRNIRYKSYGIEPVSLKQIKLSAYDGKFKSTGDFQSLSPKSEMDLDVLAHLAPGSKDNFGGKITGSIHIPRSGQYYFYLNLKWIPAETNPQNPNGAGELLIGGKKIVSMDGRNGGTAATTVQMEAGDFPIQLNYYKNFGLWYARGNDIILAVEGPGVPYTELNAVIPEVDPVNSITVEAKNEPVMLRSFVNHHGKKHTHVISVGETGAANYSVDLRQGRFLQFWRGRFMETTPMWDGRGETQLALPMGSVVELPGTPSVAFLSDKNAVWPDSNSTYNYLGYDIDPVGRPVFKYKLGKADVREFIASEDGGKKLSHTLNVTPNGETGEVWCRLAEGNTIEQLPNGLYAINDKQYYIEWTGKEKPVVRSTGQKTQELLLPLKASNAATLMYSIIW